MTVSRTKDDGNDSGQTTIQKEMMKGICKECSAYCVDVRLLPLVEQYKYLFRIDEVTMMEVVESAKKINVIEDVSCTQADQPSMYEMGDLHTLQNICGSGTIYSKVFLEVMKRGRIMEIFSEMNRRKKTVAKLIKSTTVNSVKMRCMSVLPIDFPRR